MILFDLQKALDTLYHDLLLDKMKYLGFTSKTKDWFDFDLKKRNIIVSLEKTLLEKGILNCGVPQGSILDSILRQHWRIDTFGFTQIRLYFIATKMSSSLKEI